MPDIESPAPAEPAAAVVRLVLASESRIAGSVMEELFAVRARFLAAQDSKDVHAAVLHSSGWFVIWIEGPEQGVEAVMRRSMRDPRHAQQRIIHRSRGRRNLTDRLTLATTHGADRPVDFALRIRAVELAAPQLSATEIWERLSAPWTLGAADASVEGAFGAIALMGSDENSSIEVLRRLADRFSSRVVYQRFASDKPNSRDVGAAYVDIAMMGGLSTRVLALSRKALAYRMVRESLARVQSVVLMLGSRPAPAVEMASSVVVLANAGMPLRSVQLVADDSVAVASVCEYLRTGLRQPVPVEAVSMPQPFLVDFIAEVASRHQA
ncbi:BLUF domain-containing protein [Caenimonas sp. SL110]|uniref:BLUF domain-containing protein n=1 Tax=Caenimonas sp. SL110 TaxID=1450524 RepID=UPI00128DB18D|nr:BLUF domain-containing protein [Caenimonas sp. SL110]